MTTEAEAKKRWCPFARAIEPYSRVPVNRKVAIYTDQVDRGAAGCNCTASACMAWRWNAPPRRGWSPRPAQDWEHVPAEDSGNNIEMWVEPEDALLARRTGFCGLAGRPE